jgi:hypothetical protein
MDPLFAVQLRRFWPLIIAVLVCALFMIVNTLLFVPQATRYRAAIAQAGTLGLVVDPAHPSQQLPLPVKVFTLLMDNSLAPSEAEERSQEGTLSAQMAQALSSMAGRRGLDVVVAEPGASTPLPGSIEMHAHLRLRGRYASFVGLVDDLSRDSRLWAIERFTITSVGNGNDEFDLWMAGCMLKRVGGGA